MLGHEQIDTTVIYLQKIMDREQQTKQQTKQQKKSASKHLKEKRITRVYTGVYTSLESTEEARALINAEHGYNPKVHKED
ncbi:hypothetical protein NLX67_21755 [Domibacillus sp. A3M-37]|uniref:hypothetical protein n=1 Tax=Domibacillus sp. A3M-37 TaxID=2962037 RepID=UPI0020B78856|nr:hypothetical protein [Domibacillus sp. A3M-37]MCP3764942.1 hypothetical protein [Domibacillus sp. A3M-37]